MVSRALPIGCAAAYRNTGTATEKENVIIEMTSAKTFQVRVVLGDYFAELRSQMVDIAFCD